VTMLLRYSLGPVGGFIGEARRTRDFWAGSFLLSWLTAVAIVTANRQGAEILSPVRLGPGAVDSTDLKQVPDLLRAVAKAPDADVEYEPSLPNQFRALVPDDFDPMILRCAILRRWRALAESVWAEFIAPALSDDLAQLETTQKIWESQIGKDDDEEAFWETIWVMGPAVGHQSRPDDAWLALRKRRRAPFFLGDIGPGDRCAISTDFREISGFQRSKNSVLQDKFWQRIIDHLSKIDGTSGPDAKTLELRPSERLSAPALVKRLFARLPADKLAERHLIGWKPRSVAVWQSRLGGRAVARARYWPSTAALAVAPWLARVVERVGDAALTEYAQAVRQLSPKYAVAERQSRIWEPFLYGSGVALPRGEEARADLLGIDGRMFYLNEVTSGRPFAELASPAGMRAIGRSIPGEQTGPARDMQAELAKKLSGFLLAAECVPSYHFAIIQVDGDRMGEHLANHGDKVEELLNAFQSAVRDLLELRSPLPRPRRPGDILYASADELIALTSVQDALPFAESISRAFSEMVAAKVSWQAIPTVSVSVTFLPVDYPLASGVRASSALLDRVKEETRHAGAVGVQILGNGGAEESWIGISEESRGGKRSTAATLTDLGALALAMASDDFRGLATNNFLYSFDQVLKTADPQGQCFQVRRADELQDLLKSAISFDAPFREYSRLNAVLGGLARLMIPAKGRTERKSTLSLLRILKFISENSCASGPDLSEVGQ